MPWIQGAWLLAALHHVDGANVTVSGETTGAAGCMSSGLHTPETYIKTSSNTPLLQKGTPVRPTSYLTFTGGQSATVAVGTVYDLDEEALIFCSILDGDFWIVNGPPQFEIAYERSASLGTRTGCVTTDGITYCFVSQTPWCSALATPPDLNVLSVYTETYPVSPAPFFENWAACARSGAGQAWSCSPAFSLSNFNSARGLALCTKTP